MAQEGQESGGLVNGGPCSSPSGSIWEGAETSRGCGRVVYHASWTLATGDTIFLLFLPAAKPGVGSHWTPDFDGLCVCGQEMNV